MQFEEFDITLMIRPLKTEEDRIENDIDVIFDFKRIQGFDQNWKEFLWRKSHHFHHKHKHKHSEEQNSIE